jgi:hypothetical protein
MGKIRNTCSSPFSLKKLNTEYGDVFFCVMPLKQVAVLGPDNRDLLDRDNTRIIFLYEIRIIRATSVHLWGHTTKKDISILP